MGNIRRRKDELRRLAQVAKERMKSGYWDKANKARNAAKKEAAALGMSVEDVNNYYRLKFARELTVVTKCEKTEDDILYERVCEILKDDEDISNPLPRLIDKEKYDAMDSRGKQRHVLMLAAKYEEFSKRYFEEKKKNLS